MTHASGCVISRAALPPRLKAGQTLALVTARAPNHVDVALWQRLIELEARVARLEELLGVSREPDSRRAKLALVDGKK
jgi:hypothetical protein